MKKARDAVELVDGTSCRYVGPWPSSEGALIGTEIAGLLLAATIA
jgi:hypothetical protein